MMKRVLYIGIIALLASACQPEMLKPNTVSAPKYLIDGEINGSPFTLSAGPNNIIAETQSSVSENGLLVFESGFHHQNCEECGPALYFDIVGEVNFDPDTEIAEYLPLVEYPLASYYSGSNNLVEIAFDESLNIEFFVLTDNDGDILLDSSEPVQIALDDGIYNLLFVYGGSDCSITQSTIFEMFDGEICSPLPNLTIEDEWLNYDTVDFNPNNWLFMVNEQAIELDSSGQINLDDVLSGEELIQISLLSVNIESCTSLSAWNFEFNQNNNCLSGAIVSDVPTSALEPLTVTIHYIDDNGVSYISEEGAGTMNISSLNATDSQVNANQIFELGVTLDCTLIPLEGVGAPIDLTINQGIIPVSF